jgi:hypothetical protein
MISSSDTNKSFFSSRQLPCLPTLTTLIVMTVSTVMLYLLVWDYGAIYSWKDPRHYLATGFNFYQGNGLFEAVYDVTADSITFIPLTYYPPVTSITYALFIFLGISPDYIPGLVSLLAWPLFLSGIGLLTYRLSQSGGMATFSVILAAITCPYLTIFTGTNSEVIFLPLLIFLTIILTDLPEKRRRVILWLIVATITLALLMLTRYVGAFFYATVVLWWSWWRIKQRQFRRLVGELFIFATAAVSFFAWITRNLLLTGHPFGPKHLTSHPNYTFTDTIIDLIKHSSWVILPAVRPGPVWRTFGWVGLLICAILVAVGAYLLWHYRSEITTPPRTPLPVFVIMYFALFTFIQPLIYINSMSARYMTVALSLIQPWLLTLMARVPRRWAYPFLSSFIALNLGLMVSISVSQGVPNWIRLNPPTFQDLANRPVEVWERLNSGMPVWLLHYPPRLHDLVNHHQDVFDLLESFDSEVAIVSNAPDIFTYRLVATGYSPVSDWLSRGTCTPQYHDVAIIIFDWDIWAKHKEWPPDMQTWIEYRGWQSPPPAQLQDKIGQKCPDVPKIVLSHSVIYYLPKQTSREVSGKK